jgi:hypothetical protein
MTQSIKIPQKLDDKYIIQPASMDNLNAYAHLHDTHMMEENGTNNVVLDELRGFWEALRFYLEKSTQAVFTMNGQMVGCIEVRDTAEVPVQIGCMNALKCTFIAPMKPMKWNCVQDVS